MIKKFKHKIAFLLCLVFISRIMFVQIGIFYLSGSAKSTRSNNQNVVTQNDQKLVHFETEDQLKSGNYWTMEILESTSDAGSKFKPFILPVIPTFNAVAFAGLSSILRSFQLKGVLSFVSQHRYLALGVFRI